ncbi:MAG TPA: hypothetical protein VGF44_15090 [Terriglobales bacterium]
MKASRVVRGETEQEVELRARLQMDAWNERWTIIKQNADKRARIENAALLSSEKKGFALKRTREAQKEIATIENILRSGIEIDHTVDWDSLKSRASFSISQPLQPQQDPIPSPLFENLSIQPVLSFWDKLIPKRKTQKTLAAAKKFQDEKQRWETLKTQIEQSNNAKQEAYHKDLQIWKEKKTSFKQLQDEQHTKVEAWRTAYFKKQLDTLIDYWELVLSKSEYPDSFPKSLSFDYQHQSKLLIVDYHFPDISCLPHP